MRLERWMLLWLVLGSWWSSAQADDREETPASVVQVGHWLQIRGEYRGDGRFEPRNIELVAPERYDELIGTIREFDADSGRFTLLGLPVEIEPKTTFARLERNALEGQRVKLEGYFRGEKPFTAREITPRGGSRDRITGRVDAIRETERGTEFQIMNLTVLVPAGMDIEHSRQVEEYLTSESRIQAIVDRGKDEEDLFGKGIRISDNLLVFGQVQTSIFVEDEFDLDQRDAEDVVDYLAAFKGRVVYNPSDNFFSVLELNYRRIWREDDREGRIDIRNERIGEAYFYWLDPLGMGLDFQLGRVDYDDEREWLYDQYLDGPKLIWLRNDVRVELSLTTVLSSGSPVDEDATNRMLYVSNTDEDRHLAAYVIHRDFDFPLQAQRTHYGVRVIGDWLPEQKSWLEISRMEGETGPTDAAGWGFDMGTSWEFHDRFALSGGYAFGSGDRPDSGKDETFRQTGLQDNNGKFAGVTSFRFYGEVADPELANLKVLTFGLGWLPRRRVSLDLVGHRYWQHRLSRRWLESQIDKNPNGRNSELGWEVDLVLGWRTNRQWDLEVVAGWFRPGDAFDRADDAFFGKVQFRYRL
jgi:alginate production protein